MKKEHSSRWRKLDNAAQAFPAATGKRDTRVFRFYCQLKEDIQSDLLQNAGADNGALSGVFHGTAERYFSGFIWSSAICQQK